MSEQATILVVDDTEANRRLMGDLLGATGYRVLTASSGAEALALIRDRQPDLVLLDVIMPGMSGYDVCRRIRDSANAAMLPVVMITALDPGEERVKGLEAGADDFLTKPINQPELMARVRSLLRIKSLYEKLESSNRTLEHRVREQVAQLDRLSRLKRFFSPQLAELIVAGGAEDPLRSHRREVTVVFVDLRGFTAFAETAEPEEVMAILREYHAELGKLILSHEATLERFAGDGMMIFFNDPVPVPDPTGRAVRMALQMRDRGRALTDKWRQLGHELELGIGIAQGFATIGAIGFEGRWDYGAIGTVTNLAARLCDEAKGGQILVSRRVYTTVADSVLGEPVGELNVRGFLKAVPAFNLVSLRGSENLRAHREAGSDTTAGECRGGA
jgi:adenylate cyclase